MAAWLHRVAPENTIMNRRNVLQIVPMIALALMISGCGSGGLGNFNLMSLEEEWRLGQQLSQNINSQVRLVNDPEANAYITRLGQALVSQTEMGQLPWQFHIINDPSVNAFNIPGGHVYVHTGLIAAADNASELAGVMAHEIAHGVERHGTEQMTKAYGLEMIATVLLGQSTNQLATIAAQIAGTGALASFSRDDEREADRLGTRMMARAGYNPRGMVTMFEKLMRMSQGRQSSVAQFFSTHPLTQSRINEVNAEIQKLGTLANLRTDEAAYQNIRRRIT